MGLILGLLLSFGLLKPAYSQYLTGASVGSYAGVNSLIVNPAMMANSRYYADVNIVSMGTFFHNNYAYFAREEYNMFKMINPSFQYPVHKKEYGTGERSAYTVENEALKDVFLNGRVIGPSAMMAYNDHTFAFHTAFRSVSSFTNIPYDMANFFYYSLDYSPQHGIEYEHDDPMRTASLTWSEIGLSWAYMFAKDNRHHWALGVSGKLLFGHAAYYVYMEELDYFVPDDDNLYIRDVTGEVGYAVPFDYSSNELYNGSVIKGVGMGFDVGLTYTHTKSGHSDIMYRRPCEMKFQAYKYRIGLSLMDFGWIGFNDVARKYEFENHSGEWHEVDTLEAYYTNLDFISDDITSRLYESPEDAMISNAFSMYLPFSLGLQFDYHYRNNWFISGTMRLPLRHAKNQVQASAGLMVVPRMETQNLEFGIPLTLHEFTRPMVGAYMRFYNVTVGTDNLAGFTSLTDHYGYDVYVSVKINFLKDRCKRKRPRFCTSDNPYRGS